MKKFIILAFAVLSTSFLCAEQPFFLKNWIIPENVRWGTTDRIPSVEGAFIEQTESVTEPLTELTIYEEDFSVIDVPPYFAERKLIGWKMNYSDIIAAFRTNNDFSVEERSKYQVFNYFDFLPHLSPKEKCIAMNEAFDSEDCILCDKYLNIYPKNFNGYYIQLGFATSEPESLIDSFKVVYCMDDSTKPYKVLFEQNHRSKWEALSETEKIAVALSAVLYDGYDLNPCIFDATPTGERTSEYMENVLGAFDVFSPENLYESVLNGIYYKSTLDTYKLYCGYLDSNPNKTAVEIAIEKNLTFDKASSLIFIDDTREKLGQYGAETLGDVLNLLLIRLGSGAGYITHSEAIELAAPITEKLLKEYVSYEDFVAHLSLMSSYFGINSDEYLNFSKEILDSFENIKEYIPVNEIVFDGSYADKTTVLKIQDAYYKPKKSHYNWIEAMKMRKYGANEEGLLTILNCVRDYGNREWFEGLYEQVDPERYVIRNPVEFFDEYYSYIWDNIPEMEQYAIAFSSNLFELNGYFQLDFTNNIYFDGGRKFQYNRKKSMKESWSITDHDTLVNMIASLEEGLHSAAYKERLELIKKYPDKTPIEIGEIENLSVLAVTRLYFIQKMDGILGKHDIEAWDDGRALTLLRWGIFLGYIDYDEAMALSIPIVNKIRDNYVSWEDFMAHYIAGRCFWGLGDSDYKNLAEASVKAAKDTRAYVPYEKLVFTAENADFTHKMTLEDCYYKPTAKALQWEKVQKLSQKKENSQMLEELTQLEAENPAITNIVFYWHLGMLITQKGYTEETLNYIEKHIKYVDSLPEDDEVYLNTQYFYLVCLNSTSRFEECIKRYALLSDSLKQYAEVKYMYAYANYFLSEQSNNPLLINIYRRRAYETLKEMIEMGVQFDENIMGWMEAYQNNML